MLFSIVLLETNCIIAGPEFGPEREGKPLILYKSMYGARTSCTRFHENLAAKFLTMGHKSSKYDPDLWVKDMESLLLVKLVDASQHKYIQPGNVILV